MAFTLPALVLLGFEMGFLRTMLLALCGGILGILMMVPLRRYLIVKEHGKLTYPEGTACAEVLIAGEERGASGLARLPGPLRRSSLQARDRGPRALAGSARAQHPGVQGGRGLLDISPELLGVGYIIGYRSAAIMVGGGLLSWLVLIPAIALFGEGRAAPLYPVDRAHLRPWSRPTSGAVHPLHRRGGGGGGGHHQPAAGPAHHRRFLPRLLPRPAAADRGEGRRRSRARSATSRSPWSWAAPCSSCS